MPFNLGPMELFIVLLIILVLFGARKVPEIGASIGKGIREFKRSMSDVERQIREPEREDRLANESRSTERLPERRNDDDDRPEPKRLLS
ncbi:MAG TPA: twin-arginine translocase TatA/TatE family subunit [Gemmatimonadaceae bacterium]|nr:twin-arginine translocase TatA/TatE family subunit [Gemmatimonadaceae bacterium]